MIILSLCDYVCLWLGGMLFSILFINIKISNIIKSLLKIIANANYIQSWLKFYEEFTSSPVLHLLLV